MASNVHEQPEKTECGAPKKRGREGHCTRTTELPYCPQHMHLLEEDTA